LSIAVAIIAALVILADALLGAQRASMARLDLSSRESRLMVAAFYPAEQDSRHGFRWTTGDSRIHFGPISRSDPVALSVQFGAPLPELRQTQFTFSLNERPLATAPVGEQPRRYHLLAPEHALHSGDATLGIVSETTPVPDGRSVGLRVEEATLETLGASVIWPPLPRVAAQLSILALVALAAHRLGLRRWRGVTVVATAGLALIGAHLIQPLLITSYLISFAVALTTLVGLTYWLLPVLERRLAWLASPQLLRALWGLTLLACVIRLIGALYPTFDAYDLSLNVSRLIRTLTGELVVTNRSIEFRNGITVYPPGPYLVFLPNILLGMTPKLVVQASIAIVDGFGALTTAALARSLGAGPRAALFSALLYAAVPVGLTALWWGLTAQVFGQALMAPLAVALLYAFRSRTENRERRTETQKTKEQTNKRTNEQTNQERRIVEGQRTPDVGQWTPDDRPSTTNARRPLTLSPRHPVTPSPLPPHSPTPPLPYPPTPLLPYSTPWLIAGVLLSVSLLSHIGVAILAVAWLGLAWLALTLRRTLPWAGWRNLTLMLAISGVVGFLFAYAPVVLLKLEQTLAVSEKVAEGSYVPAYNLIWRGWFIAFHRLGFLLLLPGLLLLAWRRLPPGGVEIIGGWLVSVLGFWAIEMVSGLQVRYIYFLTPLVCVVVGALLARLSAHGLAARRLAWVAALLLLALGVNRWWIGVFDDLAMSMVSLLR
jgi:hypothetical protein